MKLSMRNTVPLTTLKEKGQITLPADIRKEIDANKGDIFNIEVIDGNVVMTLQKIIPARKKRDLSKYIGIAKGSFGSTEEIDAHIRNDRDAWD